MLDLYKLILTDDNTSLKIFDSSLYKFINKRKMHSNFTPEGSIAQSERLFVNEIAQSIGPFYNRNALHIDLLGPKLINLELEPYLQSSISLRPYILRATLTEEERANATKILSRSKPVKFTGKEVRDSCERLFPTLNFNQIRLFTTLYYSYEFDRHLKSTVNTLSLVYNNHEKIIKEVTTLTRKFNSESELQIFNELFENITTYSSVELPYKGRERYQELVAQSIKSIEILNR